MSQHELDAAFKEAGRPVRLRACPLGRLQVSGFPVSTTRVLCRHGLRSKTFILWMMLRAPRTMFDFDV